MTPPRVVHSRDPQRTTLAVLGTYLLLVSVAMVAGGTAPIPLGVVVMHALACVATFVAWRRSTSGGSFDLGLWLPLLALPLLYAELGPTIARLHDGTVDALVLRWERTWFGEPARTLAARWPWAWLSEPLHLAYLSYYPLIYGPPLVLALRGRRDAVARTMLALTIAYTVCFAIFLVMPVEGPRYRFGPATAAPEGPIRDLARFLLERGSSRGTAFPSSHVAVATAQALMALRYLGRWGWLVAMCATGIAVGAVYGGFHYAVDVIAGLIVGLLVVLVVCREPSAESREPRVVSR